MNLHTIYCGSWSRHVASCECLYLTTFSLRENVVVFFLGAKKSHWAAYG